MARNNKNKKRFRFIQQSKTIKKKSTAAYSSSRRIYEKSLWVNYIWMELRTHKQNGHQKLLVKQNITKSWKKNRRTNHQYQWQQKQQNPANGIALTGRQAGRQLHWSFHPQAAILEYNDDGCLPASRPQPQCNDDELQKLRKKAGDNKCNFKTKKKLLLDFVILFFFYLCRRLKQNNDSRKRHRVSWARRQQRRGG